MFDFLVGVATIVGTVLLAVDLAVKWTRKPPEGE